MDYYKEKQYLAQVDRDDRIVGKVERWKAHKDYILHRAFTACLIYKNQLILQHRKHLLFDGMFDLTCSSHPIFINGTIEPIENAVYRALEREWHISKKQLTSSLENKGSTCYKAKDPTSEYGEHEVCYLFIATIDVLPQPDMEYAYGYSLINADKMKSPSFILNKVVAPWVPHCIKLL